MFDIVLTGSSRVASGIYRRPKSDEALPVKAREVQKAIGRPFLKVLQKQVLDE